MSVKDRNNEVAVDFDPFAGSTLVDHAPTTDPQREIWTSVLMGDDASAAFNQTLDIRLDGELDVALLERALAELVARHDALRASFAPDGLSFVVAESVPLPFAVERLDEAGARTLEAVHADENSRPFDLIAGPAFRARLCRTGPHEHHLLFTLHHIICDGWSTGVLFTELARIYSALVEGVPTALPVAPRYADYARAREAEQASPAHERVKQFWLDRYRTVPPPLELPRDHARPPRRTYRGNQVIVELDVDTVAGLKKLGARNGSTFVATLLASFAAYLSKVTGNEDLVIGLSAAGQPSHGVDGLVGHCVNLLPLRLDMRHDTPFPELLKAVRRDLLDAQEHQAFTFGALLQHLRLPHDPSRIPLVPVVFNLDRKAAPVRFGRATASVCAVPRSHETFEWFINAVDSGKNVELEFSFNADMFEADSMRRVLENFSAFITSITASPDAAIGSLPYVAEADMRQLSAWNATERTWPAHESLHGLIEAQVARTPDAVAVSSGDQALTYRELDERANRLAHWLIGQGVGRDSRVAVCMERSLELVIALVGILKAGGAYAPLDPDYPASRLEGMLASLEPAAALTHEAVEHLLPETSVPTLVLDREWEQVASQPAHTPAVGVGLDDAAYVIFTSGSTGRPKGVLNTHRGICNRLLWMQEAFGLGADDRVLQKTPYSFDVSVWEFFWPLLTGARLVMAEPGGHRDPDYLVETIVREQITTLHFVPSMLRAFLGVGVEECGRYLRRIICSGEALPADVAEETLQRLPETGLFNLYGPTEAAVDVTWWRCERGAQSVPIGRPIANTQIHILDRHGQLSPIGVPGELYIGGVQVARGYLGQPELTAERFVADPFRPDGRLYRTGDLARWRADGAIEFLGRVDHQVKIHGLRIELGEIEAALEEVDGIRQAVVSARGEGEDRRLVGYVVFEEGRELLASEIRRALSQVLPDFMVPGLYVPLPALPLSPNGKVDRKALPDPLEDLPASRREFEPPATDREAAIAAVWQELLDVPRVGRHDNFFELGGHSLLAIRAVTEIERRIALRLPARDMFFQSVAQLASSAGDAAAAG